MNGWRANCSRSVGIGTDDELQHATAVFLNADSLFANKLVIEQIGAMLPTVPLIDTPCYGSASSAALLGEYDPFCLGATGELSINEPSRHQISIRADEVCDAPYSISGPLHCAKKLWAQSASREVFFASLDEEIDQAHDPSATILLKWKLRLAICDLRVRC